MSMKHTFFVSDTINGVERAVRIQVCVLGGPCIPLCHNWTSIHNEERLVVTEKFSEKKKKICEIEATVSKKTVRKSHNTKRRIRDNFLWSGFL